MFLSTILAVLLGASSHSSTQARLIDLLELPHANRVQASSSQISARYPELIDFAMNGKNTMRLRWRALQLAAEIRGEEAREDLEKALGSKEWFMRNAALVALQEVAPLEGQRAALRLLSDRALVVRSAAVDVLGRHPTQHVRENLWQALEAKANYHKGQSLWIRSQIVEALARQPQSEELSRFRRLLQDGDGDVVKKAKQALEKLSGEQTRLSRSRSPHSAGSVE